MLCARRDPRFLSPPCASRLSQMDFESASWQMVTLCIDPKSTCTCVSTIHAGVRTLTRSDICECKGGCQHTTIASPSAFARGHHARRPAFSCTQRRCIDVSLEICACMHTNKHTCQVREARALRRQQDERERHKADAEALLVRLFQNTGLGAAGKHQCVYEYICVYICT